MFFRNINQKTSKINIKKENKEMGSRPAVILVMCGSSVATTNLAAVKIEDEARRRKVKVKTVKGKIADFNSLIQTHKPDIAVATAQTTERDDVKVFSGVPLISTIGQEKLYDDLFAYIAELGIG
jgi:galactitol PTS system EIIB component